MEHQLHKRDITGLQIIEDTIWWNIQQEKYKKQCIKINTPKTDN